MIAQMNFATALAPLDSPLMAEFTQNLDRINALAEQSAGFLWRLQDETGNATAIDVMTDPKAILNLSVWQTVEDLYHFSFKTDHQTFVKNRRKWFVPTSRRSMALWHIEDMTILPSVADAFDRLRHLEEHGPTAFAFDWQSAPQFT